MNQHWTIHVTCRNEPGVLGRITLAFSRRRQRLQALQFFDLDPGRPAELQAELECGSGTARDLVAHIARIVEVHEARAVPLDRVAGNAVA